MRDTDIHFLFTVPNYDVLAVRSIMDYFDVRREELLPRYEGDLLQDFYCVSDERGLQRFQAAVMMPHYLEVL